MTQKPYNPRLVSWAQDGCVGCWPILNSSSGVLYDVSGNGNHLVESATYPATDTPISPIGQSVVNGSGVTVGEGWETTGGVAAGSGCTMLLVTMGRSTNLGYQFTWWGGGPDYFIATAGHAGSACRWRVGGASLYSSGSIDANALNVVVATHDSADGRAQMWHNGSTIVDSTASYTPSGSSGISIGALHNQGNASDADEYVMAVVLNHAIPEGLGLSLSSDPLSIFQPASSWRDRYAASLLGDDSLIYPSWIQQQRIVA